MKRINDDRMEELRARFEGQKRVIRARLEEFASVNPDQYVYELIYCLLTPQSSAVNAGKVVDALTEADFLNKDIDTSSFLRNKNSYIRFHNTKAQRIAEVKKSRGTILAQLENGSTSEELREWLVDNVKGMGWKEASHFLRNIGHRNLAILDRHILRNLKHYHVIRNLPKTLTRKQYFAIERKFKAFAERVGISPDELDLLFWSMETGVVLK
jgi:N-glycosylase/DNA lyase